MFNYNVFIVLVIIGNVLSNPIDNSPDRCCFARDRYSYKVDHAFHHRIFNGTQSTTHVSLFHANLTNNLCFFFEIHVSHRSKLILHMMLNVDFWQEKEL